MNKKIAEQACRNLGLKQFHARCLRSSLREGEAPAWDELIRSYCRQKNSHPTLPIIVYKQMQAKGVYPSQFTLPPLLKFTTAAAAIYEGVQIHAIASKLSFINNVFVVHSLVSLYSKSAMVDACRKLFDEMPVRNSVSWNVMIGTYCQNGLYEEGIGLFKLMLESGCEVDKVTLVSVLPACAHLGAISLGEWIHRHGKEAGGGVCVYFGTALIDMYCKCGFVVKAWEVFDEMRERNIVTWNAMIGGFAMHGDSRRAFDLFDELCHSCIQPNLVTFICVLCACNHAGMVDKGWEYFMLMKEKYCIAPKLQHYACMVDLFGRAGRLHQAEKMLSSASIPLDGVVWGALLAACRMHNNVTLGEKAMKQLVELEPGNAGNYMILSNMYAGSGKWDDALITTSTMEHRGIRKLPGCSWVEVDAKIHTFQSSDRSHPSSKSIYKKLEQLHRQLKASTGYEPNTLPSLRDMEEEDKQEGLKAHSEKLALAFALISGADTASPEVAIRVVKNLRVCVDCHSFMNHVSLLLNRVIIVRDNSRFHHFNLGSCSCMDYW